ncbi:MAG: RHS repeat-associated core domain-containing protein, partial [Verrucomicrobiota bacterium]
TTTKTVSTLGLNRTQTATRPDGTITTTAYSGGRPLSITRYADATTEISTTTYGYETGLKRPNTVTDSRTGTTTTTFVSNTCDAVKSVTEENGDDDRTTLFTYDSRGNRLATIHPDDSITHNRYNSKNQLEATWGSLAYATVYSYDYAGRMLTLRTSPSAAPSGEPADSGGAVTRWLYDANTGLLTGKLYNYVDSEHPGSGPAYAYTNGGRLKTRTRERGIATHYYYSLAGQLRAIDYSDTTPDVLYTRDRLGRTATAAQGSLTVTPGTLPVDDDGITIETPIRGSSYTYDPGDFHLATEALDYGSNFTKTLSRHTDSTGRPRSLNVGTEYSTAYGYDNAGRLSQVWDHPTLNGGEPAGNASFSYGYVNNSNALVETVTGPAHTVTNTWEPTRDVLASKVNAIAANNIPSSFAYGVNAIGQRRTLGPVLEGNTPISTYTPKWAWNYNNSGELVSADHGADATANAHDRFFRYDPIGNRDYVRSGVFTDADGRLIDYTANALNQYTKANGVTLPSTPYDQDGNLRFDGGVNKDSQAREYVWDGENRLIEIKNVSVSPAVSLVSYTYDHLSRLIARTDATATTLYLYDGWNRIAEYSGQTLNKTYLWSMDLSGSMQGAGGVGGLLAVTDHATTGSPTFYPTFDGNGNVSEYLQITTFDNPLTTEVNEQVITVVAHFEYDPFGNLIADTEENAASFPYRFSTKPQDSITGLYYYGYRYYDPLTGRWPSRDPIGEKGGVNLYGF